MDRARVACDVTATASRLIYVPSLSCAVRHLAVQARSRLYCICPTFLRRVGFLMVPLSAASRHMRRQRAQLAARQAGGEAGDSHLNSIDRTTSFGSFAPSLDRTTSIGSEGSASPRSSAYLVRRTGTLASLTSSCTVR